MKNLGTLAPDTLQPELQVILSDSPLPGSPQGWSLVSPDLPQCPRLEKQESKSNWWDAEYRASNVGVEAANRLLLISYQR